MVGVIEDSDPGPIFSTKGTRRYVSANAETLDWECGRIWVEKGTVCWNDEEIVRSPVDLVEVDIRGVATELNVGRKGSGDGEGDQERGKDESVHDAGWWSVDSHFWGHSSLTMPSFSARGNGLCKVNGT